MSIFDEMLRYEGYLGINLDSFDISKLKQFKLFRDKYANSLLKTNLEKKASTLDTLSLREVKKLSKDIVTEYFGDFPIYVLESEEPKELIKNADNPREAYDIINNHLVIKTPYDLPIQLKGDSTLYGLVKRSVIIIPGHAEEDNRKIYFSKLELTSKLTKLTACTLSHEVAHIAQERNIGYTKDLLNREILPIFVERLVASRLDPSGELLKLYSKYRIENCIQAYDNIITEPNNFNILIYIKSTLIALKLFDLYKRAGKYQDKLIDEINKIFKGEQTVDDFLAKFRIDVYKCQDVNLLKKQI